MASFPASRDDIRYRSFAIFEGPDCLFVVSHVRLIKIAEETDRAFTMEKATSARFEFEVFGARAGDVRVEIDSIRDLGHQGYRQARCKPAVVIFKKNAVGVAARVRGVVVGAVIVDGPIHELQAAVGAERIHVEEIDYVELSDAELDA